MSALDELSESARNRGLKLVRSRVRTPAKRRFGKVGLTDGAGKPVFGMDAKGPSASPEDVADYLRNLDAQDWGASLDVAAPRRKRTATKKSLPAIPPPEPEVREARPSDAQRLVELIALLAHEVDAKGLRKRIAALAKAGTPQLVAVVGKDVVGLIGTNSMTAIHRDKPVGRITILVVDEQARGRGIGRMLIHAAEAQFRNLGCGMVEVTSNDRLTAAHAFYRHMGYERTSIRFFKKL